MELNPNATTINESIKRGNPVVFEMLSNRGRYLYYPLTGLLEQAREAKEKGVHNGTLGMFVGEDGKIATPKKLTELVNLDPDEVFRYAPSHGLKSFRDAWKKALFEKNPTLRGKSTSLPVSTVGITGGISAVYNLFVDAGDDVVIPTPTWGNYFLSLTAVEPTANHVAFPLFTKEKGFNVSGLEKALNEGGEKKVAIFTNPHNPTGYTVTKEEAKEIRDVVLEAAKRGQRIVAVVDDAYFGFFHEDGILDESLFSYFAGLHENVLAVKLDGITKEMGCYGLRVGEVTFSNRADNPDKLYDGLANKVAGLVRGTGSNVAMISQRMALEVMEYLGFIADTEANKLLLKNRYRFVKQVLSNDKYDEFVEALPYNSGFFMCLKGKGGLNMAEVRQHTLEKYATGFVSLNDNLLRIAYSGLPLDTIPTALENLYQGCKDVSRR